MERLCALSMLFLFSHPWPTAVYYQLPILFPQKLVHKGKKVPQKLDAKALEQKTALWQEGEKKTNNGQAVRGRVGWGKNKERWTQGSDGPSRFTQTKNRMFGCGNVSFEESW